MGICMIERGALKYRGGKMGEKKGETAPVTSKVTLFKVKLQYLKNALAFIRVCVS